MPLEALLSSQPVSPRVLLQLALLQLALLSSGFVLQLLSFALPALMRDWQVPSTALSGAFTLHLLGITLGAFTFGRLGDRHGRRTMLMTGAAIQALATLACLSAHTPLVLGLLRLLAGIGLGGLTPNAITLATELAPARWRTTCTTVVLTGTSLGSSLPALAVPFLVPAYGWRALFLLAGGGTLLILLAVFLWLPESLLYLARQPHRREALLRSVRRLDPTRDIPAGTHFEVPGHAPGGAHGFGELFRGRLALITTCLWVMYAGAMLAMHLITSWLPLLLESEGLGATRAAGLTGIVHLAGTAATLCSTLLLARFGTAWLIALMLVAFTSVGAIALSGFSSGILALLIAGIGFGVVGCQGALGVISGHVYPASFRPTGVGAAIAVGRLGSMMGPLAGGAVQAAGYSAQGLFTLPLCALAASIAAACVFAARSGYQPGGR